MGPMSFNPVEDPTYIIRLAGYIGGLVVRADSPWKTFQDLVAYAKQNPKKLTYASSGIGTPGHMTMERLSAKIGIELCGAYTL